MAGLEDNLLERTTHLLIYGEPFDMAEKPNSITPSASQVIPALIIFLAINFLVAAIYFKILNP